jgi:hypothetical protein
MQRALLALSLAMPMAAACIAGLPAGDAGVDGDQKDAGRPDSRRDAGWTSGSGSGSGSGSHPSKDAGAHTEGGKAPSLGDVCTSSGPACATGLFCLDAADLGGLSFPSGTSICSAACCADADCDGGSCYPTPGGNFCLSASLAMTKCGTSGCGAVCCTSSRACSGGKTCGLEEGKGGAGATGPVCASPGSGTSGDTCEQDSDCANGVCVAAAGGGCAGDCVCADAVSCCGPADCTGGKTCNWLEAMDPTGATLMFRGCQAPGGNLKANEPCTTTTGANDCEGSICASFGGSGDVCSQPCCTDADCQSSAGISSWLCRPYTLPLAGGSVELLVCQPPSAG